MELYWDYNYYQPWTDNKQMIEEIIVIRDKGDKDDTMDDVSAHQDQIGRKDFRLNQTNYRYWTKKRNTR